MIRVISNTTSPRLERMNGMVGKTFDEYSFLSDGKSCYVGGFYFSSTDIEVVDQSEDEKFRRSLLD